MKRTWKEVGDLVRARRNALGLSREDAVEKARKRMGPKSLSTATVGKLDGGKQDSYTPRTLIAYARALDWPDDALERLMAGEDPATFPTVDGASSDGDRSAEIEARLAELAGEVRRLADRMDRLGGDA